MANGHINGTDRCIQDEDLSPSQRIDRWFAVEKPEALSRLGLGPPCSQHELATAATDGGAATAPVCADTINSDPNPKEFSLAGVDNASTLDSETAHGNDSEAVPPSQANYYSPDTILMHSDETVAILGEIKEPCADIQKCSGLGVSAQLAAFSEEMLRFRTELRSLSAASQ